VIGISRDLPPSQQRFKETVKAQNVFLSDKDGKIISAYGALNPDNGIARRYYFLLDEQGTIIWKSTTGQLIPVEKLIADLSTVVR
jgi:peroxiredoxin